MAQIDMFLTLSVSHGNDLLTEVPTLEMALRDEQDFLTDQTTHVYFPVRIVMVDTDGRETTVCTVSL